MTPSKSRDRRRRHAVAPARAARLAGLVALATAVSLGIGGCGEGSAQEQLPAIRATLAAGNASEAVVRLKSLLQTDPGAAAARLLLGEALMELGELDVAEVELKKVIELKDPKAEATPALARLLLKRRQHAKLIADLGATRLADPAAHADLQTSIATAHASSDDPATAMALVDAVLSAQPDFAAARLLRARLLAGRGEVDNALAVLQTMGTELPRNVDVRLAEGQIRQYGKNDLDGAVKAYEQALSIDPKSVQAHAQLIRTHHARGDLDAVAARIAEIKKVLPTHPQALMFEAQLAFARGNDRRTRELAQQLLPLAPTHNELLTLAGAAELRSGSFLQAERHLAKALTAAPDLLTARLLLGETYLRSGQYKKALQTLETLVAPGKTHWKALQLSAEAHLQSGNFNAADTLFTQAVKLKPEDARLRTSVALTELARGRSDQAFQQLEKTAAADKGAVADLALVAVRMRRGELAQALKALESLRAKLPATDPTPDLLEAQVRALKRDYAAARASLEAALAKDPANSGALSGLEVLDIRDNKPDAALRRYQQAKEKQPDNAQILLALARLKGRTGGAKDEITSLLQQAAKLSPTSWDIHVQLIKHLLAHNDPKSAVEAGKVALAALPESPDVLEALGRAQVAAGEHQQAIGTFGKIPPLAPKSPLPHLRIAQAYLLSRNLDAAILSLKRALSLAPNQIEAQDLLVSTFAQSGRHQEAVQVARTVQQQRKTDAVGWILEGNIHMERKQWEAAITAYRAGLGKSNPGLLPARLHFALVAAKRNDEAERFAAEWIKRHPKDTLLLTHLGDFAMAAKDWSAAEKRYREVIDRDARNIVALNNVALLMAQQNRPGALAMAERAVALTPDAAPMQDTLAQAALAEGQPARAVEAARAAVRLAPEAKHYRLGLARTLLKAGQKDAARQELEALKALGAKFDQHAEVTKLLQQL